jgi:hypothetical protein
VTQQEVGELIRGLLSVPGRPEEEDRPDQLVSSPNRIGEAAVGVGKAKDQVIVVGEANAADALL